MFRKYMHIERLSTPGVEGILDGEVWIYPKLDGTNASVWKSYGGKIHAGSRNHELSPERDNQGFWVFVNENLELFEKIFTYLANDVIIYGEWLVPHTIKHYRNECWKKFYVFDLYQNEMPLSPESQGRKNLFEILETVKEEQQKATLLDLPVISIPPLAVYQSPTEEKVQSHLHTNNWLCKKGKIGEGIVIKNYNFVNRYGRTVWAKLVRADFKDAYKSASQRFHSDIEQKIADKYVQQSTVDKIYQHILNTRDEGWSSKAIPEFLSRVWHDFVTEEMWTILKKESLSTVNFKTLQKEVTKKAKLLRADLF